MQIITNYPLHQLITQPTHCRIQIRKDGFNQLANNSIGLYGSPAILWYGNASGVANTCQRLGLNPVPAASGTYLSRGDTFFCVDEQQNIITEITAD